MSNDVAIISRRERQSQEQKIIDAYIKHQYDFEIDLEIWQKYLILILNIFTGGLGTLLVPFLNHKKEKYTIILASLLLAILQIHHFLHFFSLLSRIKFLEKFYDYISDDIFLESIFGNKDNLDQNLDINDEEDEEGSVLGKAINEFEFNISETISQKSRKKFLKIIFGIISGISYANSIFTTLVNFLKVGNIKSKIFSYKNVLYSFFNPGGGILLASFAMIPSCYEQDIRGIVLSILSIIIGFIIIFCPFSLSIGLFLTRLTNKMNTLFPLKITLIYIGLIGIIISFLTSGINKREILEAKNFYLKKEPLKPFDMLFQFEKKLTRLNSTFGLGSFFRLIANIIIPGSGIMSLLCKYGYNCGIFRIAIIQFIMGLIFFNYYIKYFSLCRFKFFLYNRIKFLYFWNIFNLHFCLYS